MQTPQDIEDAVGVLFATHLTNREEQLVLKWHTNSRRQAFQIGALVTALCVSLTLIIVYCL